MTSVLVTGARGFAGAWLAKALLERGDAVVSLDHSSPDPRSSTLALLGISSEIADVTGDLGDADHLRRLLREHRIAVVFHLAAETIVATVASSAARGFETNVRGTWTLLEACRAEAVERIVVASSDKAYGAHDELPYREDFALRPTAPYEASKAAADLIARCYWLLYVTDAAAAYLAIADRLDDDEVRGEAFNAGGGKPHRVGDVVELILRLAGSDLEPDARGTGNPPGEIDRQWVDPSKLTERCGWRPEVSLEDGLRRTIDWYRAHPEVRPKQPERSTV